MTDPRTIYRENAVKGASPVARVILLYEQLIEDLLQAGRAFEQNAIELRTNKINHAVLVVGYLQATLNMEAGAGVADNLNRFYNQLRSRLVEAQLRGSKPILLQQVTDLITLRETWVEVERAEVAAARSKRPAFTIDPGATRPRTTEWEG